MPPIPRRFLALSGFFFLLAGALPLTSGAADSLAEKDAPLPVQTGPVPSWVESVDYPGPAAADSAGFPAEIQLSDAQSRLTPEASEFYYHLVIHILNAEGVRHNAEWSVEYSPETEQVTWHTLRIIRQGEVLDRLPAAKFRKLQRELGLENQLLSGEITAVTIIDDVRVGDTIEVAYTTRRADPLMKDHLSGRNYLGSRYPIGRQSVIVRTSRTQPSLAWSYFVPPGTKNLPDAIFRPAALRSALDTEETAEERIYRWNAESVPAIVFDDMLPPSASPYYPMLRCGTYRTWADVADWAEPLFVQSGGLPADARQLVDEWKSSHARPLDRLRAAVRWVQNDIRYFALAIGEHNLRPRPLPEICTSRFGDCKDKSTLLVALLRELGIEAWPALVSSYWQDRIEEHGPGPYAFNHAIVAYLEGDELRWIDPTLKQQRDVAGRWAVPPYRRALVLRPGETGLTSIPTPADDEPDTTTHDRISFDPTSGAARLETQVTLSGLQADYYRQRLDTLTADETSANWFNFIGRFYKRLEEVKAPHTEDDEQANRITIKAVYRLPELLREGPNGQSTFDVHAYTLRTLVNPIESRRRRWPYALAADRFIRHRIEIELPFAAPPEQHPQVISAEGLLFKIEKGLVDHRFIAVHDLRVTADFVAAERMDSFSAAVDEIIEAASTSLNLPAEPTAAPEPSS